MNGQDLMPDNAKEIAEQTYNSFTKKVEDAKLEYNIFLNKKYHLNISGNSIELANAYAYNYSPPKSLDDSKYNFNQYIVRDTLDNYTRIEIVDTVTKNKTYTEDEGSHILTKFIYKNQPLNENENTIVIEKDITGKIIASWKYGQKGYSNTYWTKVNNIKQAIEEH